MDSEQMTGEQEELLYELSSMLMHNNKMEADAVKGYTEQLALIGKAKAATEGDAEALAFLSALEAATEEKIADELSHSNSLNAEYTEMTGIAPKED